MTHLLEQEIDVLESYRGKWAVLYVFPSGSKIGRKRFERREHVFASVLQHSTGKEISVEEAKAQNLGWDEDKWPSLITHFPIPVSA